MDRLDLTIERKFASANQQIPGKLGNNIDGVTNLDLTDEEELITSGLYDDSWDESSSSGFEDIPTEDDIQLECIYESKLFEDVASINNKYDNKANDINRKYNRKKASLQRDKK